MEGRKITDSLVFDDLVHSECLVVEYQTEILGVWRRSIANFITKTRVGAFL